MPTWERFFSMAADLHCVADLEGRFLWVSPSFTTLLGWSEEELKSRPFLEFVHPDDRDATVRVMGDLQGGGAVEDFENRYARVDGDHVWLQWRSAPALDEGRVYATARDVTEQKRLRKALEESRAELEERVRRRRRELEMELSARFRAEAELDTTEARYRGIVENAPVAILRTTLDGELLDANREFARMLGHETVSAMMAAAPPVPELYHDAEDRAALLRDLRENGEVRGRELRFRDLEGEPLWVRIDAILEPPGADGSREILGFASDITEERSLRRQLLHAQKMEAIGTLAGGVAHDFNNLLTVMLANAQMLRDQLQGDAVELAEEIRDAALHARAVTGKLLTFSRKEVVAADPVQVSDTVADTQGMLARLLRDDVVLTTDLAEDLPPVLCERDQLQQVILNLVVNAQDAMPDGGRVTIRTLRRDLSEEYAAGHIEARPGPHVVLSVSDTGVGMDPATMDRIFEPFFTTKGVGRGTGLGLSTIRGIVERAGGHITVYSEPGEGTSFKIHLPAEADAPAERPPAGTSRPEVRGGTEVLLVVEDEPSVRRTTVRLLERLGYQVLAAANVTEALDIWEREGRTVEAAVVDVSLPEMKGPELVSRLRETHPGLRTLFVSGFSDGEVVERGDIPADAHFLTKPFGPAELAQAVRRALGGEAGADAPRRRPAAE